jgi:hypothetical protein
LFFFLVDTGANADHDKIGQSSDKLNLPSLSHNSSMAHTYKYQAIETDCHHAKLIRIYPEKSKHPISDEQESEYSSTIIASHVIAMRV